MAPRLLDENSLRAREQQIIEAAIEIIQRNGVENLTMDKVVSGVPFSKGTVYKHFLGKEDLMLAISNYAMSILADLFCRAAQFQGCPRERMMLVNFSYLLYAILHPALFKTAQCAKSPNVYGKCSEERLGQQEQLEFKLLGAIHSIVEEALASGSFTLPEHMNIQQVCFANWSVGHGTIGLLSDDVEQCEGSNGLIVERELFNQNNLLFDGLQWAPFTKDHDYSAGLRKALEEIFPGELLLIKRLGRELQI